MEEQPVKRPRGRPRADKTGLQAANRQVESETMRSEERKPPRPPRVPMATGLKLEFGKRPGYVRRLFATKPGRIEQALAAYWEFVLDDTGEKISRPSGEYRLYLMEIEKRYYDEDQELKNKKNLDIMRKEQKLAEGEYLPEGRHHVIQREDDYDPLAG